MLNKRYLDKGKEATGQEGYKAEEWRDEKARLEDEPREPTLQAPQKRPQRENRSENKKREGVGEERTEKTKEVRSRTKMGKRRGERKQREKLGRKRGNPKKEKVRGAGREKELILLHPYRVSTHTKQNKHTQIP